jgi:hypothetical protein
MNAVRSALVVGLMVLAVRAWIGGPTDAGAEPIPKITGVVVDEDGRPIQGIKLQVSGVEKKLPDGTWERNRRCGFLMPNVSIDEAGRFTMAFDERHFTLPIDEQDTRVNLWFERDGYAPTFVSGVGPDSEELKVVMPRGIQVTGHVRRMINGSLEPVDGAAVEVRLASDMESQRRAFRDPLTFVLEKGGDLPYRQRVVTDSFGEYIVALSKPPKGKQWFVVCLDEAMAVELQNGQDAKGPDFIVNVEARRSAD